MSSPLRLTTDVSPESQSAAGGYHGRYLLVDVSTGRAEPRSLPEDVLRKFLGGSGLGTYLLLQHGAAKCDPLAPEAVLAFVFSPLVGSPLTTSAKFAVVSKSPLTDRLNDSLASSGFAIAGKRTGHDALVIVGRAAELSLLVIDEVEVRLEPAGDLRGLTCRATEQAVRARLGSDFSTAVIGPAGELLVRYATISHDGRHAGRGGSGAVLGSKNIKAIAVRGTQRAAVHDPAGVVVLAKDFSQRSFGPATAKYRELGTATNLLTFNRLNALPTRNFQQSSFAEAVNLAPETLQLERGKARASCAACTIGCEHLYELRPKIREGAVREGEAPAEPDRAQVRLEYESLFALGPLCGVSNADDVLAASQRCDELGLDTISAGGTIAFAMECAARGLLHEPWLQFGDGGALLRALDLIGENRGLGHELAQGSRRLAGKIGHGSIDFAPQVKGLEIPGYEPRALQTMALGFAVATRGADHNRSGAYEADFSSAVDRRNLLPSAAIHAIATEDRAALLDSLILCKFLRGIFSDFYAESAEMMRYVTGWDMTAAELRETAQRIVTARKWFNIQAGWQPSEDTLPARFLQHAPSDDPAATLSAEQLQAAIVAYNRARGWSDEGWISELDLPFPIAPA
jgi:aldehyde:ferredoxin oxidoreductase